MCYRQDNSDPFVLIFATLTYPTPYSDRYTCVCLVKAKMERKTYTSFRDEILF